MGSYAGKISVMRIPQLDYLDALQLQEDLFQSKINSKINRLPSPNVLVLLEHKHVFTLGKSGDEKNLKVKPEEVNATFVKTNRGGDITYHGPGQLVAYPIFNLDDFDIGVRKYVEILEQSIIDCIAEYGIKGERIHSASGVWIDVDSKKARKICAIGIKVSRGITMHGLAFNVNTDLSYFEHIVPCGISDKGVSSMAKELGHQVDMNEVIQKLVKAIRKNFGC